MAQLYLTLHSPHGMLYVLFLMYFRVPLYVQKKTTIILASPVPLVIPVFLHSGEGGDEAVRCKESVSLSGGKCSEQRLEWIIMSVKMSVGNKR